MAIGSALARLRRRGAASHPAPEGEPASKRRLSRQLLAISTASLLVLAGVLAPGLASPASAASGTKVVIIVGPVGDATTRDYISNANAAASIARRYTSNVVTIYSPNATWSAVSSAVTGASVILYLGHGNGFPSPYSSTLNTTSMDGFGLNATANAGNYNWKYYGETYIRTLHFAPNAVVLFSRLCYASGDNEWGKGIPTQSVARQRVDNYAAPFIVAGAKAVIADGLGDIGWYISALFTRHSSIDSLFKAAPDRHNNYVTWASPRSSGFTDVMDVGTYSYVPDRDPYYRSMVSIPTLSTDTAVGTSVTLTSAVSGSLGGKTTTAVNLRKGASLGAGVVTLLGTATAYTVRAPIVQDSTGRTWAPVRLSNGTTGYIATEFGTFTGPAAATAPLNVRTGASTAYAVRATIAAGTRFTVRTISNDSLHRSWFAITLANGTQGWVASWFVGP